MVMVVEHQRIVVFGVAETFGTLLSSASVSVGFLANDENSVQSCGCLCKEKIDDCALTALIELNLIMPSIHFWIVLGHLI